MTNRVSRREESLKVQTAECYGVSVGQRAGDKRAALEFCKKLGGSTDLTRFVAPGANGQNVHCEVGRFKS